MSTKLPTLSVAVVLSIATTVAWAATPPWMQSLVGSPLPEHDEQTNAVMLYSETVHTVQPNGNIKQLRRVAYRILRPAGSEYGKVQVNYDDQTRITLLRGWSIPANGKDYEVREKDAIETALGAGDGVLISDVRTKLLRIPAAVPGSIVGFEYEQEERPYMNLVEWDFQETVPVKQARYTLNLPTGWRHTTTWLNYPSQAAVDSTASKFTWVLSDLRAVPIEDAMPPWRGIAGRMVVSLLKSDGQDAGMQSWRDIGLWYAKLTSDRVETSPAIKQHVAELTASAATPLQRMRALANFAQNNIRYVAIELGIGGFQPHRSTEIFGNRFGDCKDKVTILHTMLKEIGVDSHYVLINTNRGSVQANTPPNLRFNHAVIAVALPPGVDDPSLLATMDHPKLGKVLFFDPTDTLTPFGRIPGGLQANHALLVGPEGGELLALPKQATTSSGIERTAQLTLDSQGVLRGELREVSLGDYAAIQRSMFGSVTVESERIRPLERIIAASLTAFEIEEATVANARVADKPFEWRYRINAPGYARAAGDLLFVRPRVIGSKSTGFLEVDEPRAHPIEFDRPQRDHDVFEIAIPAGYKVEELPPPLKLDEGFLVYESKTEVVGGKLRYTRTLEIKELSVPATSAEKLKQLYRAIGNDERRQAVLSRTTS